MNYSIASATDWSSLECSANKVCECNTGTPTFCHTNHPLVSDDLTRPDPHVSLSSKNRFSFLTQKFSDTPVGEITEDHVKDWLSQHPVCLFEEHNTGYTFGSIVMVLSITEKPVLHLSPGPPSITPWSTLVFSGEPNVTKL